MQHRRRTLGMLAGGVRGLVIEAIVVVGIAMFALGVALIIGWLG